MEDIETKRDYNKFIVNRFVFTDSINEIAR